MANYSGSVTLNTSHYGVYLEVTESNINTPNNTSVVTAKLHITRSSWGWQTSNSYSGSITIDGTAYSFSYSPNWAYSTSGDVVVGSASKTVKHNDDGKKNCSVSGKWNTSGTYSCGTASASGTLTLTQIARASSIASNSPNIGDAITITIDRKSTSFTNTVTYDIGGLTGTIASKTTAVTINYPTEDLADQIYALIPNATQISGTVYCTTYSGNTQIGSTTSANFKLYANETDVKPEISGTIVDTNATTIALTGDSSTIIKYASAPKVTITATPKQSATIKSYNINANDGQTVNLQEYTFENGIASNEILISATDSRNYTTSDTLKPNVIDYIPVIINTFTAERTEDLSSEILLTAGGVWFNGDFSANTPNTLSCRFWYREVGTSAEWVDGGTIDATIDGNTFYFNGFSLGEMYDYQKQWQFKLRVQDLTGYSERDDLTVSKGQEVVAIGDDKVWVNGELLINDVNIIDLLYPIGRGFIDFTDTDYSNYLGLIWERELVGMTPIGYNSTDEDFNEIGKTGGAKTHKLTVEELPKFKPNLRLTSQNQTAGTTEYLYVGSTTPNVSKPTGGRLNNTQGAFDEIGGDKAHNIMQPYQVVAYWKRIA